MLYRILISGLLMMLVQSGWAQKEPFSIQTLYDLKSVADPQISPDGQSIAFTVTSYDIKAGRGNSEIYRMDKDGKSLRQMTNNPAADYHPRWSGDGRQILFVSTRKNGSQAWILPADGGEPVQITDLSMGVSDAEWLGSSGELIFTSEVFPECGAVDSCNQSITDGLENGPLQAHMADRLLFRHWNSYKDGRRAHLLRYDPVQKTYQDLTPGDYDSPALWGSFTISADGKWLCVESNRDAREAETTNKDLFLINLITGQTTNLTEGNEAYDGQPVFSPNSRFIAFQKQLVPTFEADRMRLAVYDLQSGSERILTDAFDNWTEDFAWSPDARFIYFKAHEKGHFPLYRVEVSSRKIERIIDLKTIDDYALAPDGKWLAMVSRSIDRPAEIFKAPLTGKDASHNAARLTGLNKSIKESTDIRPAEELWIAGAAGRKIHTFLIKPHNFDPSKKYPMIINVHGGPQMQWADAFRGDWQIYPGYGYIVAFPNPTGSTGYGQAFTDGISRDWAGKVYEDIMAVTDSLARLPYVDAERMGAMGWSYGGYMMMWLEGHTTRFKAIASMMGVFNLPAMYGSTEELWFPEWDLGGAPWNNPKFYQQFSPHNYVAGFKTPCLVITGEKDYRIPYTQSLEFFTALQKMNVPSRLIVFKNDGHWPNHVKSMPFYYNAHLDWFHQYLGGEPAPYDMKKMLRNNAFTD